MAEPKIVYVGLSSGGVYYTQNFDDPGGDPTWTAVNDGLASTAISNLQLDAFSPETRQYCVADGVVYMREDGAAWASILSTAEARVVTGMATGRPVKVWSDLAVADVVWVLVSNEADYGSAPHQWALKSDDYGETWTSYPVSSGGAYHYAAGGIVASGDYVYVTANDYFNAQAIHWSVNGGVLFTRRSYGGSSMNPLPDINPYVPTDAYGPGMGGMYRVRANVATAIYAAFNDVYGISPPGGVLWSDPDDTDHMRLLMKESIIITDDDWATYSTLSIGSGSEMAVFAPIVDPTDAGRMIIGRSHNALMKVVTLENESDTTLVNRSGNNYNTPPYNNAIPSNAGGVVSNGVQAIPHTPTEGPTAPPGETITPPDTGTPITLGGDAYVQAVTMPDYTGHNRGEPLPGDRGAWAVDTEAHGQLHASDIAREVSRYHLPLWDAAAGEAPVFNGISWQPQDIATQAELNDHAADPAAHHDPVTLAVGSDSALTLNDQELTLADVLTPAEHTAIGDSAPHHAAVTLGAGNDAALALSGQELTLTLPEAGGTTYRQFTYVDNGDGTWSFVTNSDGMPVFANLDTE